MSLPLRTSPDLWAIGDTCMAGVDEVGRGCLAGPVVAAAVIIPAPCHLSTTQRLIIQRVTDSKRLSSKNRQILAAEIQAEFPFSIGFVDAKTIDKINILQASFAAMALAVEELQINCRLLVDGKWPIPKTRLSLSVLQTPVIKGDLYCKPIGAASIVAKVARDVWMEKQDLKYPQYGFAIHKGYPTPVHKQMLRKFGPCRLHRKTFAGVTPLPISVDPDSLSEAST